MKLACMRVGFVLQQRAAGLSAATGLFLEEHLVNCVDCQHQANLLAGLRQLHAAGTAELSRDQRTRAIKAALSNPMRARKSAPTLLWQPRAYWLAPLFAAAAVLIALRVQQRPVATAPVASGDRLLSGQLTAAAGRSIADGQLLHTRDGAALALAHAKVELRPASSARWNRKSHELRLESGSVFVDVDERRHERFEVRTDRFTVLVLGTRFEVSASAVRVLRGRVSVRAPSGAELAQLDPAVHATWQWTALPVPNESAAAEQTLPAIATTSAAPAKQNPVVSRLDPNALIEQAQRQLAERRVADARHSLEAALGQPLNSMQRAEALSLVAEAALVAGDFSAARIAYMKVAQRFAHVQAGETALFAAARIATEHGSSRDATTLLNRYLERYPNGRFVREVRARLESLATSKPTP